MSPCKLQEPMGICDPTRLVGLRAITCAKSKSLVEIINVFFVVKRNLKRKEKRIRGNTQNITATNDHHETAKNEWFDDMLVKDFQ